MLNQPDESLVSSYAREHLRLQAAKDVGPVRFHRLLHRFGSVNAVFAASAAELEQVEGIGPHIAKQIIAAQPGEPVDAEVNRAVEAGVRILCSQDADYPQGLKSLADAPTCLYVRGRLEPADAEAIAIVGTRRCSHYGGEQALRFAEGLARAGFTIVSGLARGVDGQAHRGALQAGGRTIAVLGNGLPAIYPPEHAELATQMEGRGAIITELPMNTPPDAKNFPRRNRIIAGLSLGVLVIEAGSSSGALITAEVAQEYGRRVFAIPGRVDQPQLSGGVHNLIRSRRAMLVTCLEDVLDNLNIRSSRRSAGVTQLASAEAEPHHDITLSSAVLKRTVEEEAVLKALRAGASDVDAIQLACGCDIGKVMSVLTSLELKALVRRMPGNRFELRIETDG